MSRPATVPTTTTRPARPSRWGQHRRALGLLGALAAAGMTALWVVVVPEKAGTTEGLHAAAIRLGHPLSWALLSTVGLAVAAGAPKVLRDGLAWAALVAYAAFLLALLL